MEYRRFGRTDWKVSEIGYGMWGMGGWTESDDIQSAKSLDISVERGVNFFDTAWGYGEGHSERLLGELVKRHSDKKLYLASKIPPMNFKWPSKPEYALEDCFPYQHIIDYAEKTLTNLGTDSIDLLQFHVWDDGWGQNDDWQKAVEKLKKEGKVQSFGISVNRWEPENCIKTIDTNLIDSIQVIYNIFDQAPEDKLFNVCREKDVAIIARVPFDEGTLTGNITKETTFPEGDWRGTYFVPENLNSSAEKADLLRPIVPENMTMAEMALRFILMNQDVATIIPGMRKERNVMMNTGTSDGNGLSGSLHQELKNHRWDRQPTSWSQ